MLRRFLLLEVLAVTALLAACGGGGGGSDGNALTPEPEGPGFKMGVVTPSGEFQKNEIFVGLTPLSAGGETTLRVNVVDRNGRPITQDTEVVFTSNCVSNGVASIESPVTTAQGVATTTYQDRGCGNRTSEDVVTARTSLQNETLEAETNLMVAGSSAGAIEFVTAEPQVLSLRNTGSSDRPEVASVRFRVVGSAGTPQANQRVNFRLFPASNDAELLTRSARSGDTGLVTARVRSGTAPTPFRVEARLAQGSGIATQSSQLSVGTGLPAQKGVSLSQSVLNPEALQYDGVEVEFTIRLADQFGNPVADGTAVNFSAEGGQIGATGGTPGGGEDGGGGQDGGDGADGGSGGVSSGQPSCQTVNGACTVTWRSSAPRPDDGRVSILAYALGEETLRDNTGNNRYDGRGSADGFVDLSEAYRDDDYVGAVLEGGTYRPEQHSFTAGVDRFIDFNGNGIFDTGNNAFDGILCRRVGGQPVNGCTGDLIHVFDHALIVLSGSSAIIEGRHDDAAGPYRACNALPRLALSNGGSGQVELRIADVNGNPMPAGTEVEITASDGFSVEAGQNPFIWPSSAAKRKRVLGFTILGENSFDTGGDDSSGSSGGSGGGSSTPPPPERGTVTVTVTTPGGDDFGGITTTCSFPVSEDPPDEGDFSPN